MVKVNKNDFIEIEFIAKVKDGEVFDTNIPSEAKKLDSKIQVKPLVICVGQAMLLSGLDKQLEGKEIGKKYSLEIQPEEGFGERKKELVKLMPLGVFTEKNVTPRPGMTFALDNFLVKIITVSGGRVLVDFNHPLSGKILIYDITINKKIQDLEEKVNALNEFFFKSPIKFKVEKEKKKIIFEDKNLKPMVDMFKDKYKEVLGFDIYV